MNFPPQKSSSKKRRHLIALETQKQPLKLKGPHFLNNETSQAPSQKLQNSSAIKAEEEPPVSFDALASKLEQRIGQIENDLRNSMGHLENDLSEFLKNHSSPLNESDIKNDLEALVSKLENRFSKTLSFLESVPENKKIDKKNLEAISHMATHIIKVLSFDFYKNVLGNLQQKNVEEEIDSFGMDERLITKIKPVFDFLYYRYWRVKTTGIENIPNQNRALIVSNHSGTLPYDGAMIKTAIINEHPQRNDARFLVEDFVYHMPLLGTFMYRIGGVRASPENAERLLNAEHLVIVFPEGVKGIGKLYTERYKLQRFGRGGFIKLCMKTRSPLVPVAVVGAEEIHPILFKSNVLAKMIGVPYIPITPTFPMLGLLGCVPLPTQWSIQFGKPFSFDSYGSKALDDDLLIHKLSEEVRSNIQNMVVEKLKHRSSIWSY